MSDIQIKQSKETNKTIVWFDFFQYLVMISVIDG